MAQAGRHAVIATGGRTQQGGATRTIAGVLSPLALRRPRCDDQAVHRLTAACQLVFSRRTRQGLVYLVLTVPLDVLSAAVLLVGGLIGTVLLVTPFGAWLVAFVLRGAVRLGGRRRAMAAQLLGEQVPAPPRPDARGGLFSWRRAVLGDPVGWRALAYALAKLPVAVLSVPIGLGCYVYGLVALTYFPLVRHPLDRPFMLLCWAAGVLLLLLAPWLLRFVLAVDRLMIRGLLGPSQATQRLAAMRETRDRLVVDADATLRRIERDLHDGAQARLIGVGMQLTMARELLAAGASPERLGAAVETAQDTLVTAIAELRDLVRGIHPPVLDRGLEAALATVAAGSAVPVTISAELPWRPPPAIESIAYFSACELLTNAGRHAGAQNAAVHVALRDGVLLLRVRDDGRGGARPRAGGGLAGLAERVGVVDGRLTIDSPPAGPTVVTVEIPCPSSAAAAA